MKSFVILTFLTALIWITVAVPERDIRYYEAKVVITNTSDVETAGGIISGAYATIGTPYNVANCVVLKPSKLYTCDDLPLEGLISSCYPIHCDGGTRSGEITAGSAVTTVPDGIIIPARDIRQRIKRIAIYSATTVSISLPVIVVHRKDAFLLSATGVTFSVSMGDELSVPSTPSVTTEHGADTEQPHTITKSPLYYVTLFMLIPMFIFMILIFLAVVGMTVIWMCRNCAIKRHIKCYVKDVSNIEQDDDTVSHCCICLEEYKMNDVMGVLPCQHEYHKLCINKWLTKNTTCPLCKWDILSKHENSPGRDHEMSPPPAVEPGPLASVEDIELNFSFIEISH